MDPKNNLLQKWMEEFKREEIRAVQGLGKYHLAQEHQTFAIDPATCDKWGKERWIERINLFHQYSTSALDAYEKPKNAFSKTTPRPINVEKDYQNRNCLKKELKYH